MTDTRTVRNRELFAEAEKIFAEGGRIKLKVKGFSMRPFLVEGRDAVELAPIEPALLRQGMVVLFRRRGRHILHRIRRIDGNTIIIKGDGNYRITETCTRRDITAYVESIERKGRTVGYGSVRWRWLTCQSLTLKLIRTLYRDLGKIKSDRKTTSV